MSAERNTRQRRTIRDVVERADRPLSIDEILDAARASIASLGTATVYRSIRTLLDEGWLTAVDVPGRGKRHHHHFACSHCKRVYELGECAAEIRSELPAGFVASGHEITIYGTCAACFPVPR